MYMKWWEIENLGSEMTRNTTLADNCSNISSDLCHMTAFYKHVHFIMIIGSFPHTSPRNHIGTTHIPREDTATEQTRVFAYEHTGIQSESSSLRKETQDGI